MLTVETIGRIRREHFVNGKTIRQIARDLRVSRNTVRKMLRSGETSLAYDRDVQPLPKLGRWTTDLDELLARNETKAAREQLTLIRIFEELRGRLRARHLRQHEDGCGDDLRRQATPLQSPLPADVQPLPRRSGRVHAGIGMGEGASREPGRAGPRAVLHTASAVQEP